MHVGHQPGLEEAEQAGQQLALREVAGGAEQHDDMGVVFMGRR